MAWGPGKYDDEATLVRERTKAKGVIVIVLGGDKGPGFACQADSPTTLLLPKLLREIAGSIEADLKTGKYLGQ